MKDCVVFKDYDKISDDLMYFGNGVSLKFNVSLSWKDASGNRHHFLEAYRYDSKYDNYGKVISVKRKFDFYMSIDVRNNFGSSVMINPKDIMLLRMKLRNVYKWFQDETFKIDKKNKLHIVGSPGCIRIDIGYKFLIFEPRVLEYDNGEQKTGIRMFINSDTLYVDYSVDTLMEFIYLVNSINMYESAQMMVAYIEPEFEIKDIHEAGDPDRTVIDESQGTGYIRKSNVKATVQKSFFDELDSI